MDASSEFERLRRSVGRAVNEGIDQTMTFLGSPTGRTARAVVATGLVLATPVILRHPFFRTPVGRLIEVGGAAALIAKGAEIIRDWEPTPAAAPGAASSSRTTF
jgi:hypothetical protein